MTHGSGIGVPAELAALFAEAQSDATVRYLKVVIVNSRALSCTYTGKSAEPSDKGKLPFQRSNRPNQFSS